MASNPFADSQRDDNEYSRDDYNPFQAPEIQDVAGEFGNDAEMIRREHLSHEASVKSVGSLYLLGGVLAFFAGLGVLAYSSAVDAGVVGAGLVFAGVLQTIVAVGLQRLRRWARVISILLSVLGLLAFPVGTLINGYILFLMLSAKGSMVFSDHYQEVIHQTPHIKYKTSPIVKIFGLLLLLALVVIVAIAFVG